MIRLREGERESILTIEEFERLARRGELSPFVEVCLPAMTGERFVLAREFPLFNALFDPRRPLFQRHFHLGRLPIITGALGLLCATLFVVARDLGDGVVTREVLLALGAKVRARVVDDGEAWRLLAANLLHRDITHLAFNLFALLNVGTVLEGVYRRGDYILLLVVGCFITMAVSTAAGTSVTVGASGVVFACLGAAVVFGLRFSEVLPHRYRIYFGVVVVGYAAAMFLLGLQRASTDNWGHAGGLAAGIVMGGLLEPRLMRLREAREPAGVVALPWVLSGALVLVVLACGPLLPALVLRWQPYHLDSFGIVVERPSTWSRGPDPLGFLAFGNGIDALASIACARSQEVGSLEEAQRRFVEGELRSMSRSGHLGRLEIADAVPDVVGEGPSADGAPAAAVPARRVPFRFLASDGPFEAEALIFIRGEVHCAFVLAHRAGAAAHSVELLGSVKRRLRLVETRAQREGRNAVLNQPRSVRAILELALAHQAVGHVHEARAAFVAAAALLDQEPAFATRVRVGRARFELWHGGDLDLALRELEEAGADSAGDVELVVLLVDVLLARHERDRAMGVLQAALTRSPDDPRLRERNAALAQERTPLLR